MTVVMARYVICPDVAIELARRRATIRDGKRLLAPALLRSQLLTLLYQAVRRGELAEREAARHLDYVRGLGLRLLGDRVLQGLAWRIAGEQGWTDTYLAEYVALTRLQADALITLDATTAAAARSLVDLAPVEDILA